MSTSKTPRITKCKNLQKDMLTKDPNFGVFSNTSVRVSETYQLDWSKIYSIFDNDDLSYIQDDQPIYKRIRDSGIHMIATRLTILPYNNAVRWIIDHANRKYHSFNNSTGFPLANFCYDIFLKNYALEPFRQLLNVDFIKAARSRYNFDELLKSWMNEPCNFSQRKDGLYPIEWFKEPYSLLATRLCRLYGLPNYSYFKEEWDPINHHVITTCESLP